MDTPSHKILFLAVQSFLSQIVSVLLSYDICLPFEFQITDPVVIAFTPVGATHVYQALPSGFGVTKLKVPDIVELTGALDMLYLPLGVELTIVVPRGIPDPEIIVPDVIISEVVRMVPETDPVIVLIGWPAMLSQPSGQLDANGGNAPPRDPFCITTPMVARDMINLIDAIVRTAK